MGRKRLELTGKRFGRLTVIEFSHLDKDNKAVWKCLCDCGNKTAVRSADLKSMNTKSCGCYRRERMTTHGMLRTRVYRAWSNMLQRCNNIEHPFFEDYGGRGVHVCDRWFEFENFYADMRDPLPNQSIDRIDVNGDYSPENCRWADRETQCNNKRNTYFIEYKGLKQGISQWARWFGIKSATLRYRILIQKWDIEKALITPIRKRRKSNERTIQQEIAA